MSAGIVSKRGLFGPILMRKATSDALFDFRSVHRSGSSVTRDEVTARSAAQLAQRQDIEPIGCERLKAMSS